MFVKDQLLKYDPSPHSPHNIIPALIKEHSTVLDVGCNTGFLGKLLNKKRVKIDGIDINEEALAAAKAYYRNTYIRDLYREKLNLGKNKYDYIVFADILEHLPRPDIIINDAKKYLQKDGRIIVSLPNIARFEIRLQLLLGSFDYQPGIIGPDHLRFFTKKSAIEMIENCGFEVKKIIPTGLGHKIKILSTLTAFQFIYVCQKK